MNAIPAKDDLIVIAGAGGFIGGSLVRYFHESWRADSNRGPADYEPENEDE